MPSNQGKNSIYCLLDLDRMAKIDYYACRIWLIRIFVLVQMINDSTGFSQINILLLILVIICGALSGLGGYTFTYAKGFSYLSTDPKACANCHVMQEYYDNWQKSSHHTGAVCADCHMPHSFFAKYWIKAENGYLHSKAFTLQNFRNPIQIRESSLRVLNKACLHCHADMATSITKHSNLQTVTRSCTRCHSNVGH